MSFETQLVAVFLTVRVKEIKPRRRTAQIDRDGIAQISVGEGGNTRSRNRILVRRLCGVGVRNRKRHRSQAQMAGIILSVRLG